MTWTPQHQNQWEDPEWVMPERKQRLDHFHKPVEQVGHITCIKVPLLCVVASDGCGASYCVYLSQLSICEGMYMVPHHIFHERLWSVLIWVSVWYHHEQLFPLLIISTVYMYIDVWLTYRQLLYSPHAIYPHSTIITYIYITINLQIY